MPSNTQWIRMIILAERSLPRLFNRQDKSRYHNDEKENFQMKLTKIVVFLIVCLVAITSMVAANFAAQPAVTVGGVYEHFTVGKESGDLEGMRVVIVSAGGGYYAIVQIAQGGAEDPKPEFVPADVKGKT